MTEMRAMTKVMDRVANQKRSIPTIRSGRCTPRKAGLTAPLPGISQKRQARGKEMRLKVATEDTRATKVMTILVRPETK